MRTFRACFKFQLRLFFVQRNLVLAILFLVMAAYFVQSGSSQYKDITNEKNQFVQIEKKKVEDYQNYSQLSYAGIRIKFYPSPLSIFFCDSGIFSNLSSDFDIGERLNLSMSLKGNYMFKSKPGNYLDFNGLLLLFGSLAVLLYGCESLWYMDFLGMAATLTPNKKIYFPMVISRFLVLCLYFLLVFALGIVIVLGNGIRLSGPQYLLMIIYFGIWVMVAGVLFWLGCIIGQSSRKTSGILTVFLTWILLVYGFPLAVNRITMEKSKAMVSNHQMELEKWQQLMKFEERAKNKVKEFSHGNTKTKEEINLIESFWNIEYKDMMEVDHSLETVTKKYIEFYQRIASITPLTFLSEVTGEIGSQGYENGLIFLKYSRTTKDKFCQFIKQKRFYANEPKDKKPESFIKAEENVFYGVSRLPGKYLFGLLLHLLLLAVFILFSYRRFNSSLYRLDEKEIKVLNEKFKGKTVNIKAGESQAISTRGKVLKNVLFSLLAGRNKEAGKNGFTGSVRINNQDILRVKNIHDFLYVCSFQALPQEVTTRSILMFCMDLQGLTGKEKEGIIQFGDLLPLLVKKVNQLDYDESLQLLTTIPRIKSCPVYLFYETVTGMSAANAGKFVKVMRELEEKDAAPVYLSTHLFNSDGLPQENGFLIYPLWFEQVERLGNEEETKQEEEK